MILKVSAIALIFSSGIVAMEINSAMGVLVLSVGVLCGFLYVELTKEGAEN